MLVLCVGSTQLSLGSLPSAGQLQSVLLFGSQSTTASTSVTWSTNTSVPSSSSVGSSQGSPPTTQGQESGVVDPPHSSLSLSLSTSPIPARLVQRIRGGEFVEMRDLLGDNIALTRQLNDMQHNFPAYMVPPGSRPRLREVTSLPSWVYCFLTYLAVKTTDRTARDGLTYARLIVMEALRHGNRGWLDYDRLFRQQAALDPSLDWTVLQPSLVSSTILGHRPGSGMFCTICQGFDHLPAQCAMAYLQHPMRSEGGRQTLRSSPADMVCWSWNEGACTFPGPGPCFRRHVCATCSTSQHRARDCKDTPVDSRYKRPSMKTRSQGGSAGPSSA